MFDILNKSYKAKMGMDI
jgi:hypothetical protein